MERSAPFSAPQSPLLAEAPWVLSEVLTQGSPFDERSGRIMNPSLAEYQVPVHLDEPRIEIVYTDIPDDHTAAGRTASARSG